MTQIAILIAAAVWFGLIAWYGVAVQRFQRAHRERYGGLPDDKLISALAAGSFRTFSEETVHRWRAVVEPSNDAEVERLRRSVRRRFLALSLGIVLMFPVAIAIGVLESATSR